MRKEKKKRNGIYRSCPGDLKQKKNNYNDNINRKTEIIITELAEENFLILKNKVGYK